MPAEQAVQTVLNNRTLKSISLTFSVFLDQGQHRAGNTSFYEQDPDLSKCGEFIKKPSVNNHRLRTKLIHKKSIVVF